jgi:hypothetical protein
MPEPNPTQCRDEEERTLLSLPNDQELPFFAYGSFKPGELAFSQLEAFLDRPPVIAEASGALKIRDGLPFLVDAEGAKIDGYLLYFKDGSRSNAYKKICEFEPRTIYSWEIRHLVTPGTQANLLIGKVPNGGADHLEDQIWSFRLDPVFQYGLLVVKDTVTSFSAQEFESASPTLFDWSRFFRLQMAYLLLWSAIERFTSFAFGPAHNPMKRVELLGRDDRFAAAVRHRIPEPAGSVTDSRDPKTKYHLDPAKPGKCVLYYYQVRSNLSHRGKSAFKDGNLVRKSLVELLAIFEDMLDRTEQYRGT